MNLLIRYSTVPWILILLCWLNSHAGVDHGQYLKWAEASVTGDIEVLANEKDLRSVSGVPYSPWSAGPGLLIAPVYLILSPLGLQGGAGLISGMICVALFWNCFYLAVRELTNAPMAAMACMLAAVGTPIGYYCCSISSETLTLAPAGFLLWQTVRGVKSRSLNEMGIVACTAILLMIRPFLGVFAWPALLCGLVRSQGRVWFAVCCSIAIGLALIQVGIVNQWMTGEWTKTPYAFGDQYFQSFDWSAPYLWHVLFDPFHGLATSHPLVLVGLLGLPVAAGISFGRKQWLASSFWITFFLAALLNIYFQSCWFYWWMAKTSFGMRGLVLCGLPAILCIASLGQNRSPRLARGSGDQSSVWIEKPVIVFPLLGMLAWGWLNLSAGPLNCTSMEELLIEMSEQLSGWLSLRSLASMAVAAFVLSKSQWIQRLDFHPKLRLTLALIWFLTCAVFVRMLIESPWHQTFTVCSLVAWILIALSANYRRSESNKLLPRTFVVTSFAMLFFFSILAHRTRHTIQTSSPDHSMSSGMVFNWPDTRRAYVTLSGIPRLAHQQKAIVEFFQRNFDGEFMKDNFFEYDRDKLPVGVQSRLVRYQEPASDRSEQQSGH